ncbi:RING/U-box superfamily protein [Euphorbia peplus]|nr:RING/U-box superfamily protein [Euphorbia peplus]
MGGACCVAARDKNIVSGPSSDILHRNIRHSPSWSFRWDNRGRVAGEETSVTWFSDANNGNEGPNIKYSPAPASGDDSPLDSFQRCTWPKSPSSEGTATFRRTPASDRSVSRNVSLDSSLEQVKESTESPAISDPSPMKLSLSLPSTSSVASPASSQNYLRPAHSTTPSWPHQSFGRFSDSRVSEIKSTNSLLVPEERPLVPSWSNEPTRGSHGGSSDGWSMHAFSELMASSQREKWSSDNDSLRSFNHEKTRSSDRLSMSSSVDLQTCGVCSKLLTEKSLWSSQKLVMSNELSVVSVLICGHVYHAECLETLTPEISKYDPCCPVCTMGEKQTRKLSQKAFKAELDLKAKNKRLRNRIVDSDLDVDSVVLDRMKSSTREGKGTKMASSSSMKSSSTKPFLKRHFSFGSKVGKSMAESNTTKKKGFFWTRSLKV